MKAFYAFLLSLWIPTATAAAWAEPAPEIVEQSCPPAAEGLNARCVIAKLRLGGEKRPGQIVTAQAIILPATGKPVGEAVFVLEGGPGIRASDAVQEFARDWRRLRQSRDLVVFDTRGLGPEGLFCTLKDAEEKRAAYAGAIFPDKLLQRCRAELEQKTDLTRFTSTIMAEDLDAVRGALGYSRISLIGYSYGSRLAQGYVRLFPERTASVLLLGPIRMDSAYPSELARETEVVFDLVISGCVRDAACAAAYPKLREERNEVVRRLSAGGLRANVTYDGARHEITIAPGIVTSWLRSRLYSMETAMEVPKLIHQLAVGDTAAIAQSIVDSQIAIYKTTAMGLWLSLTCAEDLAFVDLSKSRERARGTIAGEDRLVQQAQVCNDWPRAPLREGFREPVRSAVPVLVIAGGYDPVARPDNAKLIVAGFEKGELLLIPNESHVFRANWDDCTGAGHGFRHSLRLVRPAARYLLRATDRAPSLCLAAMTLGKM